MEHAGENKWLSHEYAKRDYVSLLSAKEERAVYGDLFSIDTLIDTEQFYMFSGVK